MNETIFTVGHSTHPIDEFVRMLQAHGIEKVVDVRTIPKSRHNPQFNEMELGEVLRNHAIAYTLLAGLGGLRRTSASSINTAWKNASFRGYADYMQTPEFAKALDELIQLAKQDRIAVMCAEAVPWRCHRSLVADALLARGVVVEHVVGKGKTRPHRLTPFARIDGRAVTYPPPPAGADAGAGGR